MAGICSNNFGEKPQIILFAAFLAAIAFLCSCNRDNSTSEVTGKLETADVQTNAVEMSELQTPPLSAEEQEAELVDDLISRGKTLEALRHARNLMDSTNVNVRVRIVELLGWIGKRAIPEITEMMNDRSSTVSTEALTAWEQAFAEIDGRHRQTGIIIDTAKILKNPDHVNSILLHLSGIDQEVSLPALATFIESGKGTVASECARDIYKHITGGEVYESPDVTRIFLEKERSQATVTDKGDIK